MQAINRSHILLLALGGAIGCANVIEDSVSADVPLAVLACPERAEVGVPFSVDGSASTPADATAELSFLGTVEPALVGTFTATVPGPATVKLTITDDAGRTAEALCRFAVDGDAADPSDPTDPTDPTDPSDPTNPSDPADPVVPDPEPVVEDGPIDLGGAFALVGYDRPQLHDGPLDPALQCGDAPHLALVELVPDASGHAEMTATVCDLTLPNVQIFLVGVQQTTVPIDFVEAMSPLHATVNVRDGRFQMGAGPLSWVIGASLAPGSDMPVDANDPRVFDEDNDGNPGGTIVVNFWGDQQVVYRRTISALSGRIVSSNEVRGDEDGNYQVDAETTLLTGLDFLVPAGNGMPSRFAMLRIDGQHGGRDLRGADGNLTCDDVRAHKAELLAAVPAPPTPAGCAKF